MPAPRLPDDVLKATVEAKEKYGSELAAAAALGMPRGTFQNRLRAAAARGFAPGHFDSGAAPGFTVGKVTVQRGPDGNVERTWERQAPDKEAMREAMLDVIEGLKDELVPVPPIDAPVLVHADLCNLYTFTDYHLGMYAWHSEAGADWDLAIAERVLLGAMRAMVQQSPQAHAAVINIQGDFLHTDGKLPVTPAHKHVLDADSRYPKIRRSAIRLIRELVKMSLERHQDVHLIIAEGNHDEEGAGWLADLFAVHYEEEPRLTVNDSALPFYVFEWGDTMLGVHHGHKVKNEQLPLLFAAQFSEVWGRTKRREIHCGHRHHRDEKEYNGVTVVQHPTLAARDAYAARGGWIADRAAQAITYHKRFGQVGRVMVCPEMIES